MMTPWLPVWANAPCTTHKTPRVISIGGPKRWSAFQRLFLATGMADSPLPRQERPALRGAEEV